jgi:hypothetical protein
MGAKELPKKWKYMAWIDADLSFLNQNWVQDTIHELQEADMVQLWRSAVNLGPHGETVKVDKSFAYMFIESGTQWVPSDKYGFWHPGYAWACTRSAYEKMGGLVDWAILGSGDRHMAMALAGLAEKSCPGNVHPNYMILLKVFQNRIRHFKTSWVDGTIVHYWHGSFADRRYKERWDILTKNNFDPFQDIGLSDKGLMQLTQDGQRFETFLEDYFVGRKRTIKNLSQQLVGRLPDRNPLKWVPVVSTCIGVFALCFQIPCHLQLSSEFSNLQARCSSRSFQ